MGAFEEAGDTNSTASSPNNSTGSAGAAYVFVRSNNNAYPAGRHTYLCVEAQVVSQHFYLNAGNTEVLDQLGINVAINLGTLVIGANKESGDVNSTTTTPNNNAGDAGPFIFFSKPLNLATSFTLPLLPVKYW